LFPKQINALNKANLMNSHFTFLVFEKVLNKKHFLCKIFTRQYELAVITLIFTSRKIMGEIINKIEQSGLVSLDLAVYTPKHEITLIDLSEQLWQGLVLKEKDFRGWIKEKDWSVYGNKAVLIICSTDAIIPAWAYMLVGSALSNFAYTYSNTSKEELTKQLISLEITKTNLEDFRDKKVIVKGCSDIPFPEYAMLELTRCLIPVVKSLMFGEPCSTVPIYKKRD
jgi:hypothetical protein